MPRLLGRCRIGDTLCLGRGQLGFDGGQILLVIFGQLIAQHGDFRPGEPNPLIVVGVLVVAVKVKQGVKASQRGIGIGDFIE